MTFMETNDSLSLCPAGWVVAGQRVGARPKDRHKNFLRSNCCLENDLWPKEDLQGVYCL